MIAPFDPKRLFRTLQQHGVRFVVVGDFAAWIHGSPHVMSLADVCHDTETGDALLAALRELDAQPRDEDSSIAGVNTRTVSRFSTSAGALNCWSAGYAELAPRAVSIEVEDIHIRIASIDDLLRIARAGGTAKDRAMADILANLAAKLARGSTTTKLASHLLSLPPNRW